MRRVLLAVALVLGTATAAPSQSTYTDNALHFSVLVPAGWKEGRLREPNPPPFTMVPPGYQATGARCVLVLRPGPPELSGLTQDQYKKFVQAGWFKKSLAKNGLTLISSELVDRGAYLVELDEVRGVPEGQASMFYQASTISDGILYRFSCMIHEADYARAKPEMARIVRSFAVTP